MKNITIKLLLPVLAITTANFTIGMGELPIHVETAEQQSANQAAREAALNAEYRAIEYPGGVYAGYNEPAATENILSLIRMGVSDTNNVNFELQKKNITHIPANDPKLNAPMSGFDTTILDYLITKREEAAPKYQMKFDKLIAQLRAKGATGSLAIPQTLNLK